MKVLTSKPTRGRTFILSAALSVCSLLATAQTTPSTPNPAPDEAAAEKADPVSMSPFVINAENDQGYQSEQTLAGSRSAANLLDIPSGITIINKEMLTDLNVSSVYQALNFGVSGVTRNQTIVDDFNIRGFRTNSMLRQGVSKIGDKVQPMYDIERVEVIKGPSSMLLGNVNYIGGAVNLVERTATSKPMGEIELTTELLDSNTYARASVNVSGPLVKGPEFSLNYRVTLGGLYAQRTKELESPYDQRFLGGGLAMFFGKRTSLTINGYYYIDDSFSNGWDDAYDVPNQKNNVDPFTHLVKVKLNPYSTPSYSAAAHRHAKWDVTNEWLDATFLTQLTENGNLRFFYNYGSTVDRGHYLNAVNMLDDNVTLIRQNYYGDVDTHQQIWQVDYNHRLDLNFMTIGTTLGADGLNLLSRGKAADVSPGLPPTDIRNPDFAADDAYFATHPFPGWQSDNGGRNQTYTYYFQENLSFLKDRLILIGGLREIVPGGTENDWMAGTVSDAPNKKTLVHKYGVVVKPFPWLSLYYTDAKNVTPASPGRTDLNARGDQLGEAFKDSDGVNKEFGVKLDYEVSKGVTVYGNWAHFDMAQTNIRTFGSLANDQQGLIQSARNSAKGWEMDVGVRAKFQTGMANLVATYFDGNSAIAADQGLPYVRQAADFVPKKYSLLARYVWTAGPLDGLMIGGGLEDQTAKRNGISLIDFPMTYTLFTSYQWTRHWSTQLNIENLSNERYIVAVATPGMVQVAEARQGRLSVRYKW